MKHTRKLLVIALVTALLAACGGGISGNYAGGMGSIKFESDKAYVTLLGNTIEAPYTADSDRVVLRSPQGNLVLTRNKDGSLSTPWGTMRRQ